jgi:hypothetical protein
VSFFSEWAVVFMKRLMRDFALSADDAAAIIGNAGHESGGFQALQEKKPLVPGSRGGYGIMQWTGPRRKAFEAYCARNGLSPSNMDANYKFLFVELQGPEGRVLGKLRAAPTLDAKVAVFSEGFLRPGIPHMASRRVWAARAITAYRAAVGSKAAPAPTKSAPPPRNAPSKPAVARKAPAGVIGIILAVIGAGVLAVLKSKGVI